MIVVIWGWGQREAEGVGQKGAERVGQRGAEGGGGREEQRRWVGGKGANSILVGHRTYSLSFLLGKRSLIDTCTKDIQKVVFIET